MDAAECTPSSAALRVLEDEHAAEQDSGRHEWAIDSSSQTSSDVYLSALDCRRCSAVRLSFIVCRSRRSKMLDGDENDGRKSESAN